MGCFVDSPTTDLAELAKKRPSDARPVDRLALFLAYIQSTYFPESLRWPTATPQPLRLFINRTSGIFAKVSESVDAILIGIRFIGFGGKTFINHFILIRLALNAGHGLTLAPRDLRAISTRALACCAVIIRTLVITADVIGAEQRTPSLALLARIALALDARLEFGFNFTG